LESPIWVALDAFLLGVRVGVSVVVPPELSVRTPDADAVEARAAVLSGVSPDPEVVLTVVSPTLAMTASPDTGGEAALAWAEAAAAPLASRATKVAIHTDRRREMLVRSVELNIAGS
jgi:hypothetical protein